MCHSYHRLKTSDFSGTKRIKIDPEIYNNLDYKNNYDEIEKLPYSYMDSGNHVDAGLPNKTQGIYISSGTSNQSIGYLRFLAFYFGGAYYRDTDSNDKPYKWLDRGNRRDIKFIFECL
jgi:hypothetical protein